MRPSPGAATRELRPRVSRRVHPAAATGLGLFGHPVPEFPRASAGSASLRWRRRWDRLRGLRSAHRACLFRVLLDRGLAGVAREDLDRLDVDHLQEAVAAQLPSHAAVLHAAKGHPRIRLDDAVDEHHPGFDLRCEFIGLTEAPRPDARAQAELGVVRLLDRGAQVRHRHHGCDRAERFLAEDAHVLRDVAEQRGLEIPALPTAALSADLDLRALRDGVLHLAFDLIPLRQADQRTDISRRIERIPPPKSFHPLGDLCGEPVAARVANEEPFGTNARLPPFTTSTRY